MILVDTSVWVDHLRAGNPVLARLLQGGLVLVHPWVTGEIALGHLSGRKEILDLLASLPQVKLATAAEVMALIETRRLFGRGVGYVDVHLLAAALLTAGAGLWTLDRRLSAIAADLGLASGVPKQR